MKSVQLLIDLAREKAHGNEAELARQVGVPLHHPHEWRTGKRAVTAEAAVALCDYLGLSGEEAREWVAIAMIENPKNASRMDLLKRALFACWVLGVGILVALSNDASARTDGSRIATIEQAEASKSVTDTLYIVAHWLTTWLAVWTWLKTLFVDPAKCLRLRLPGGRLLTAEVQ